MTETRPGGLGQFTVTAGPGSVTVDPTNSGFGLFGYSLVSATNANIKHSAIPIRHGQSRDGDVYRAELRTAGGFHVVGEYAVKRNSDQSDMRRRNSSGVRLQSEHARHVILDAGVLTATPYDQMRKKAVRAGGLFLV